MLRSWFTVLFLCCNLLHFSGFTRASFLLYFSGDFSRVRLDFVRFSQPPFLCAILCNFSLFARCSCHIRKPQILAASSPLRPPAHVVYINCLLPLMPIYQNTRFFTASPRLHNQIRQTTETGRTDHKHPLKGLFFNIFARWKGDRGQRNPGSGQRPILSEWTVLLDYPHPLSSFH